VRKSVDLFGQRLSTTVLPSHDYDYFPWSENTSLTLGPRRVMLIYNLGLFASNCTHCRKAGVNWHQFGFWLWRTSYPFGSSSARH